MNLKEAILTVVPAQSAFAQLLGEAVSLYREMAPKDNPRFPGGNHTTFARNGKLTKEAFLAMAIKNARTTEAKLRALQKDLAEEPDSYTYCHGFMGEASKLITGTQGDQRALASPPRTNLPALVPDWNLSQLTSLYMECVRLTTTVDQVFALAVLLATERDLDCWGTSTDLEADRAKAEERQARFKTLCLGITAARTQADEEFVLVDPQTGIGRLVWKVAPTIAVYPLDQGALRLVEWLAK